MNNATLINQTSGDQEWYTPESIIETVRLFYGGWINLDPASSETANKIVRANSFFSKSDDGLQQDWFAKVWVNWPFGRIENPLWVKKIIHEFTTSEYRACHVTDICCICYACTSEAWFQPLAAWPQCFVTPRTNYRLPDGTIKRGVTKGSVITYLGKDVDGFHKAFRQFGEIKVRFK